MYQLSITLFRILCIMILSLFTESLYSFPQVEEYPYVGTIVYDSNNNPTGLIQKKSDSQKMVLSFYNEYGDPIKKRITTKEKKYIPHYEKEVDFIKQEEIDSKNRLVQEVLFKAEPNQLTKKIIILPKNKIVRTDYTYVRDPLSGKIKFKLEHNKDKNGNYIYNQPNKRIAFRYYKNGERKDVYSIDHNKSNPQYEFERAEIYRFNSLGKISSIVFLDKNRQPEKYIHYFYNKRRKLREIQVYDIIEYAYTWEEEIQMIPMSNLRLKNSFIYYYTTEVFDKIKRIVISNN